MTDLTRTQRAVARHLLHGWDNERIARELRLTEQAVKNHVHDILASTKTQNRLSAVLFILRKRSALAYVMELPL